MTEEFRAANSRRRRRRRRHRAEERAGVRLWRDAAEELEVEGDGIGTSGTIAARDPETPDAPLEWWNNGRFGDEAGNQALLDVLTNNDNRNVQAMYFLNQTDRDALLVIEFHSGESDEYTLAANSENQANYAPNARPNWDDCARVYMTWPVEESGAAPL